MRYKYPHAALDVIVKFASHSGDCATAILATASALGFETGEHLLDKDSLECNSENALQKIVDKETFDFIKREILKREAEGSLQACKLSPDQNIASCFTKCPLLMDLLLQAEQSKA